MAPETIRISSRITIPLSEISFTYARSGGPGGQNVNKVSSKATLRFPLRSSPSIPQSARTRALVKLAPRLTKDGALVVSSSAFRDQPRNRGAALRRFQELLADAVAVPKKRFPTRPAVSVRERRLTSKKARSRLKRERMRPERDD